MYISSDVSISDSSRLITCVIVDCITHSAISSSALGSPTATIAAQISCLIITNTDAPILRAHKKDNSELNHISAEPEPVSELVFLALGDVLLSVPVIVLRGGSDVRAVTFIDPGINLPPGEQPFTRQQLGAASSFRIGERKRRRETAVA